MSSSPDCPVSYFQKCDSFLMEGPGKVKEKAFGACEIKHDINANLTALPLFLTPF
jgi:hypothetical protein